MKLSSKKVHMLTSWLASDDSSTSFVRVEKICAAFSGMLLEDSKRKHPQLQQDVLLRLFWVAVGLLHSSPLLVPRVYSSGVKLMLTLLVCYFIFHFYFVNQIWKKIPKIRRTSPRLTRSRRATSNHIYLYCSLMQALTDWYFIRWVPKRRTTAASNFYGNYDQFFPKFLKISASGPNLHSKKY